MFYLLDKKQNISSFKCIKEFAKNNNISKIGHTGTLDPMATGLLLVATNDDTKLIEFIDTKNKSYKVKMKLGYISDTYDITGNVEKTNYEIPSMNKIQEYLTTMIGISMQTPPPFSARKIDGKRAYVLARQGQKVKLNDSQINISKIENFKIVANNEILFDIEVSRGTYIRSIVHKVGLHFKCGAVMSELDRFQINHLSRKHLGQITNFNLLFEMPILTLSKDKIEILAQGKRIEDKNLNSNIYVLEYENEIVGVADVQNNIMKSKKILGNKITWK